MGKIIISHSSKDKNTHFFKYLLVYANTLHFLMFKRILEWANCLGFLFMLGNLDLILIFYAEIGGYKDT